jgi:hypothetical protein
MGFRKDDIPVYVDEVVESVPVPVLDPEPVPEPEDESDKI